MADSRIVRAKVYCREIVNSASAGYNHSTGERTVHPGWEKVSFSFVNGNDPNSENARFWEASPGGDFWMNIQNPQAQGLFELGKEYYVDLTPAE